MHIPDIWKHRVAGFWQERVFGLLLDEMRINETVAAGMRGWRHSGFSMDNSVRIEKGDHTGMQRLVEYIARCPFSLARMVKLAGDGTILYRATHSNCLPFPLSGDTTFMAGIPRNFEVYDPLDFLAEVTQHIPNRGEHQIRYYGWYSNKKRGMQEKKTMTTTPALGMPETDTSYRRKCRITWAALIKAVYEVDPLKCPKCGGEMKIVGFIEEHTVIERILRNCGMPACRSLGAGRWKEPPMRAPPVERHVQPVLAEPALDYGLLSLRSPM